MDDKICRTFFALRNSFSNNLEVNGDYQFIMNQSTLNGYCTNNKCSSNLEKINAGCLFLFDAFFKDSSVFSSVAKNNINIVEYIIMWLSYMLNLKEQAGNMNNIQYFYTTYINNDKYKNTITDVTEYKNYKDLIDKKKDLINMNIKDISKFYDAFNTLCMIYIEFDEKSPNCNKYSGKAKEFVEKYKKLKEDSNITGNSSYNKLLSTLSNDYDNFKKKCSSVNCKDFPLLQEIKTTQPHVQSSKQIPEQTVETSEQIPEQTVQTIQKLEQISEVASSSSSIGNKLFTVLSIFGAIAFFSGIGYKYSLFKSRKRSRKHHLREKLKNKEETG
ncbi:BIR protein [Plasmodium berghei ANKA]|uniref:BIR protein n=1 Tax=Plasmodium berghei (strain Anka) TaxID=5823 RepID=A0A509ASU7_PLABA|nr:BIR protein [Plasmodium berghei ANKA]VUC58779.1 BIR protein [Plasmodium berghei ANKA]|eukprot:XP_034424502.1 BIR protein [Plasmodium berghei ANKA]